MTTRSSAIKKRLKKRSGEHRHSMSITPHSKEASDLLVRGSEELCEVQCNGIHVDIPYCKEKYGEVLRHLKGVREELDETKEMRLWENVYGSKTNLQSKQQLSNILYNKMEYEPIKYTENEQPSTTQEALSAIDTTFVNKYLEYDKFTRIKNNYLKVLINESVDGKIYPFFNLNTAATYRSSSADPNFHSIPVRDEVIGPMVRKAIVPREGYHKVEIDYEGIEVHASAWNHQDQNMLEYIANEDSDMHKDMSTQIFKLDDLDDTNKNEKAIRKTVKNDFVFPEFYGDYYLSCAKALWGDIQKYNLRLSDNTSLKKHLKNKGIKNRNQFIDHIQRIEDDFWGRRFNEYYQWRLDKIDKATKLGYLDSLNGFRFQGVLTKNAAVNYPIQCVAFHCLLWSLIQINTKLRKEKWRSKIEGQIHDAIVADVHTKELAS